jgi:anti-sigma regulatory factor (Ser/Thr protein kinase)
MPPLLSLALHHDQDVVTARQRAAQLAASLGFDLSEQTRIATAVSEIVRNAFRYATQGLVEYSVDTNGRPQRLVLRVADRGGGIESLDDVLSGTYRSRTGMGIGIQGARRLMDRFSIESSPRGTTVVLEKFLPPSAGILTPQRLQQLAEELTRRASSRRFSGRTRISCARSTSCSASSRSSSTSTASSKTPIAASWPSTPSSTRKPTTSDAPTR